MLRNKVVFITGASSGIGALMARTFAQRGAIPILTARSQDKLQRISESIQGQHQYYPLDVTSDTDVNRVVTEVIREYGGVDILINNAGFGLFDRFENLSMDQFKQMMEVNYFGIVRCIKAIVPHMKKRNSGHIINIASMAGKVGTPKSTAYSATKHAVLGFTDSLRHELARTGISVTVINPGPIHTPFFDKADPDGQYLKNLPSWFVLKPEKVVKEVVRAAETKKPEINLPWMAAAYIKLVAILPGLGRGITGTILNRK